MATLLVVSDQTFEQEVLKSESPVFVDFWAQWSEARRKVAPLLEEVASEEGDKVKIATLDVDANAITGGPLRRSLPPTIIRLQSQP